MTLTLSEGHRYVRKQKLLCQLSHKVLILIAGEFDILLRFLGLINLTFFLILSDQCFNRENSTY